jgi:integrase
LIFGGTNVKTVQLALGHSKPSITLDTYTGLWPEEGKERTRHLIDACLGEAILPKVG